jgi:hypothetical protein
LEISWVYIMRIPHHSHKNNLLAGSSLTKFTAKIRINFVKRTALN